MQLTAPTPERPIAIRSTLLRSVLLVQLYRAAGSPLSVAQLCDGLRERGFTVRGRPSKVVSDALRTELEKGRAVRVGRGRYQIGHLPRTTRWRCQQRVRAAQAGHVAAIHLARPTREAPEAVMIERFQRLAPRHADGHVGVVARRRNGQSYVGAWMLPSERRALLDRRWLSDPAPRVAESAVEARDPPP